MAYKLPLYVRQNFSVRHTTSGDGWALKCDTCGQTLSLLKPPAGMPVEEFGLRMVRRHVESHLIPRGMKSYRVVGGNPNDLVVAETHPGPMPDGSTEKYDHIYNLGGGSTNYYMVLVYAANEKHARTKAAGLIRNHINPPSARRHHWRLNPR